MFASSLLLHFLFNIFLGIDVQEMSSTHKFVTSCMEVHGKYNDVRIVENHGMDVVKMLELIVFVACLLVLSSVMSA